MLRRWNSPQQRYTLLIKVVQSITKATTSHHSATHPPTIASSRTIAIRDLAESIGHPVK
jgi:hypothetical protein